MRKILLSLCLLAAALLLLTGCRARVGVTPPAAENSRSEEARSLQAGGFDTAQQGDSLPSVESPGEGGGAEDTEYTRENPDAQRKEFDAEADAEAREGAESSIHGPGEGDGAGDPDPAGQSRANALLDGAERAVTQTLPAEEAERMGVSEEAETADSAAVYYTVLLRDRLSALYECKRLNVYWELEEDFLTVFKTSAEHQLILDSGCYDVSARLTEERLRVDTGWVCRKNPDVIVKVVSPAALAAQAAGVRDALRRREGWQQIGAVREGRVLLLSSDALDAPHLRLAAALALAKTAYPDQFEDVDPAEALNQLCEEATGLIPEHVYFDLGV